MENILGWVKSGLLFGVFSSVILMLSPNKSYEKHISLVVGMLFIMVMIHPVSELLGKDGSTYISYIRNYIAASENGDALTDKERELYEESVGLQLESVLIEAGYPVKRVRLYAGETGDIEEVYISFSGETSGLEKLEMYLDELFEGEVKLVYE